MGLMTWLSACLPGKPGLSDVNRAIEEAPGVTASDLTRGPGGGLGKNFQGSVSLDVPGPELRSALDGAWKRGVEVIRSMDDVPDTTYADAVHGVAADGTKMFVRELLGPDAPAAPMLAQFYEHYGLH